MPFVFFLLAEEAGTRRRRISTDYTSAASLLKEVDLDQPFRDTKIAGIVRWIAGVVQGEVGEWELGLRSLDEAITIFNTAEMSSYATRAKISKGGLLTNCGLEGAHAQFLACLVEASGDPLILSAAMIGLITTKAYFDLDVDLPFTFSEFVTAAEAVDPARAWIPYCRALTTKEPLAACDLFLNAERELAATSQLLPATLACLFAAFQAARGGRLSEAREIAIRAATVLRSNRAFAGRLALASEMFLRCLDSEVDFFEHLHGFLKKVRMPYRNVE